MLKKKMIVPKETAKIDAEMILDQVIDDVANQPVDLVIEIKTYQKNRTIEQNRLIHALFREMAKVWDETRGEWFSPDSWKLHLKQKFIGSTPYAMPDGSVRWELRSTADLNSKELSEFVEHIYRFAAESEIPLPAVEYVDY